MAVCFFWTFKGEAWSKRVQNNAMPYPAVLLGVPLGAEGVERLAPLGAVGELEEAGEGAPVVGRVGEDGVLEVDAVGQDVIVLIHPAGETNRKTVRGKPKLLQELLSCRVAEVLDVHESNRSFTG